MNGILERKRRVQIQIDILETDGLIRVYTHRGTWQNRLSSTH